MKIRLKHLTKPVVFSAFMLFNTLAFTQVENFNLRVQNLTQTAPNKLEFDVYLLDTDPGQAMELASCQIGFLFNSLIFSGGTVSVTIDNSGSGLNSSQIFTAIPNVDSSLLSHPDQTIVKLAGRQTPSAGGGTIISTTGYGTLLTHFIITSTVDFVTNSTPNITFLSNKVTPPLYATAVHLYINYSNVEIDVTPGVNAIVADNPALNPPPPIPSTFNVTGTGSYCEGNPGLPVGLDNSETGVTYTLYKNGIEQSPAIDGTGSAISFGNQLLGTYTIKGTNITGTSDMAGSAVISENPLPPAPEIGDITHPTCTEASGSVELNGLPSGEWILKRSPDDQMISGSGSSTVITNLVPGTYAFSVTNENGCTSQVSGNVVINDQPVTPSAPLIGTITQPTCVLATGSVVLNGLPAGNWTLTRNPGSIAIPGTGTSTVISGLDPDTYTFSVTNEAGCISAASENVIITTQPPTPDAPEVGTITQPTCNVSTGSVELIGLPVSGQWTIIRSPGNVTTSGLGTSVVISNIPSGTYTFTVTNVYGCVSSASAPAVINNQPATPSAPTVGDIIPPSCTELTGSVELNGLPANGTWTLTRYPGTVSTTGSGTSTTISGLSQGPYNFTVTNEEGCTSTLSANVVIPAQPPTPALPMVGAITHPDCVSATGSVVLNGLPAAGNWTLVRTPSGESDIISSGTTTTVTDLPTGTYTFQVINSYGCISLPSDEVVIDSQPPTPEAPEIDSIIQPDCETSTGIVEFSDLPSSGNWTLTRNPGGTTTTGNGTTAVVSGIPAGIYTFTVTNSFNCTSTASEQVEIEDQLPAPPSPVQTVDCSLGSGNAVINVTSPVGPNYSYRLNSGTFQTETTFAGVQNGSHTITVRNQYGCTTTGTSFDVSCGCANPPVIVLGSTEGKTCSTVPVTVSGNTFGGSATSVTITEDGAGSVSPSATGVSPFGFTYTPAVGDEGRIVTITVTTNNPLGAPCASATAIYRLTVYATPSAPVVGTITHPTCTEPTGSVVLNGLPTGNWTLISYPGDTELEGNGTTTTVPGLNPGNYTFAVINSAGCVSGLSANVIINPQPPTPSAPQVGTITQPDCAVSTGSVNLTGLPSSGNWTVVRTPGNVSTSGNGTSVVIPGIPPGTYTFTVINNYGCISAASPNVVINPQPVTPSVPIIGNITHPTCTVSTGSVELLGLPAGNWSLIQYPGGAIIIGSGTSRTITGLNPGTYNYAVRNDEGCVSAVSASVVINSQPPTPGVPVIGAITQPGCTVPTGSIVLGGLPSAGIWTLTINPGDISIKGDGNTVTISDLSPGTYFFRVTNEEGCTSGVSSGAVILPQPPTPATPLITAIAQPSCTESTGKIEMRGLPSSGNWTITRNPGNATTAGNGTSITLTAIPVGTYTFTVTNSAGCTSAPTGNVTINPAPPVPTAPVADSVTHPTCTVATGSIALTGLPEERWRLTSTPGSISIEGSGTNYVVRDLSSGTYTFTVTNSAGCTSPASSAIIVNPQPQTPSVPLVGTITPPTCTIGTGSVTLRGLPSTGNWIVIGAPGGISSSGTGTSTTISDLLPGTYTFTVRNEAGCTSAPSANVIIPAQPPTPEPPVPGEIKLPTCIENTGSVVLYGLPAIGTWKLVTYPGMSVTEGSGTSFVVSGLATGTYNFIVINSAGCTSASSVDVNIPAPPPVPSAPVVGTITQPTCDVAEGSVDLSGLPASGTWTLTRYPGRETVSGSGTRTKVADLPTGTYSFTVTNADGCTSEESVKVTIDARPSIPTAPVIGNITHPTCTVPTGSVLLTGLPSVGDWILTRSPGNVTTGGSGTSITIYGLNPGTYTYTVTNADGCTSAPSSPVVINPQPPLPPVPQVSVDCSLGAGNAVVTVTNIITIRMEYRLDGGEYQSSPVFTRVANGDHTVTLRNSAGCTTTGPVFSVNCGCANPPKVELSSSSGSTCGTTPVTIRDNIFGGSATSVIITENGAGYVTPITTNNSPFSFTYRPAGSDAGKTITITVTTNNPLGSPCHAASATYELTVYANPGAPSIGPRTHPTCTDPFGSVVLNGLPSSGEWKLTRSPDNVVTEGSGISTTVTGLNPGTYTFTVTNAGGCTSAPSSGVVINPRPPVPDAPAIGTVTQPTCAISTGSVVLNSLPSTGNWTVIRTPGAVETPGSGTSVTITGIPQGTYTFTVRNSAGCVSEPSNEVVINPQPPTPAPPSAGTVTPPVCTNPTGSVVLMGLPSTGTWKITRFPGTIDTTGTGTRATITGLLSGTYNFIVTNSYGCSSTPSANVVIPVQPPTPAPPTIGTITQPTFEVPTGSVVLRNLPAGNWTITRYPQNIRTDGSGSTITIRNLPAGVFTFTVTNSYGCVSDHSDDVVISTPGIPELIITNPEPVCTPSTVDITVPEITAGSTPGLIYTYWIDQNATIAFNTPKSAVNGTYYIKGTTVSGFFDIKPVSVIVLNIPVANAGVDMILDYTFSTTLNATLNEYETGVWTSAPKSIEIADTTDPKTLVTGLSLGDNFLIWTVTNGVCPSAEDIVKIEVRDMVVPTIITPNYDGKNDYFVLQGLEELGRTELVIFDRRGMQVYKNQNYNNDWDGVDYNNNPLPEDTYFYVIKAASGKSLSGYVVIRR